VKSRPAIQQYQFRTGLCIWLQHIIDKHDAMRIPSTIIWYLHLVLIACSGWVDSFFTARDPHPSSMSHHSCFCMTTSSHHHDDPNNSVICPPSTASPRHRPRIPVLQYHNDWVCINKPPGITVHRSKNTPRHERVLTTSVKRQLGRKVYPVHRLDHRTSGALLLAFDSKTAGVLHDHAIRKGTKQYIALLRGEWTFPNTTQLVEKPLRVQDNVAKEAQTKFTLLATTNTGNDDAGRCSLVLCEPLTGRTHQIRRHAREINHPIIGDSQHGDSRVNRYWREQRDLDRLALHCWTLEFGWETSHEMQRNHCIVAPLPDKLRTALETFVPDVWATATAIQPRLLMEPYDEREGTHGRHYRRRQISSPTVDAVT
jgi:tRNA pseudouridine65 synthase